MTLPTYTCLRCGDHWVPRTERPVKCPACKSPYWDKPRGWHPHSRKKDRTAIDEAGQSD